MEQVLPDIILKLFAAGGTSGTAILLVWVYFLLKRQSMSDDRLSESMNGRVALGERQVVAMERTAHGLEAMAEALEKAATDARAQRDRLGAQIDRLGDKLDRAFDRQAIRR